MKFFLPLCMILACFSCVKAQNATVLDILSSVEYAIRHLPKDKYDIKLDAQTLAKAYACYKQVEPTCVTRGEYCARLDGGNMCLNYYNECAQKTFNCAIGEGALTVVSQSQCDGIRKMNFEPCHSGAATTKAPVRNNQNGVMVGNRVRGKNPVRVQQRRNPNRRNQNRIQNRNRRQNVNRRVNRNRVNNVNRNRNRNRRVVVRRRIV